MARVRLRGLAGAGGNLVLALLWASFALVHVRSFLALGRASALLMVGKESLDAFFYLTRPEARSVSRSPYAWAAGIGGTFAPMLLRPTGAPLDSRLGQAVLCLGLALQAAGMLSLRHSISIVPAHRGIKTGGLYRWVRHPLYLAYSISQLGYLLCNPTARNAGLVSVAFLFQVLRIFNEERFLRLDPEYVRFSRRTRWALVPGVF